jgi:hypothetical protein
MNFKQKLFSSLPLLLFLICSACTGISGRTVSDGRSLDPSAGDPGLSNRLEASRLLQTLSKKNDALSTFKGIGKTELMVNDTLQSARVAWLGSRPSQLRFEILDVLGRPAVRFSIDGDTLYFNSRLENRFIKKKTSDPDLKHLLSIPIKTSEVIELLSGRIPIHDHTGIQLSRRLSGDGYLLTLKKKWTGTREKIYLDENKTKIQKIETFRFPGRLVYRATFDGTRTINGFELPSNIVVTDTRGTSFKLRIDHYYTNVPVSPSAFILKQ